jgi:hypothetical protein
MRVLLRLVQKLIALVLLLLATLVLCGLFGSLHDQISYTVSREYFTLFKFPQFGIDLGGNERLGAATVGFLATWWMGIPIGATLGTISLFAPEARTMLTETFRAFLVVTCVTLLASTIGLLWGYITFVWFSSPAPEGWFVPKGTEHLPLFLCAGNMHNAGYIGGVLGLLLEAIWLSRRVSQLRRYAAA